MNTQRVVSAAGRTAARAGAIALFLSGVACSGALDVPNPQAFGNDALNNTIILKNVTNGAEGVLQLAFDDMIQVTELLSDEIESTSTWIDWEDISEGRVRHDWPSAGSFSDPQNQLLRATRHRARRIACKPSSAPPRRPVRCARRCCWSMP